MTKQIYCVFNYTLPQVLYDDSPLKPHSIAEKEKLVAYYTDKFISILVSHNVAYDSSLIAKVKKIIYNSRFIYRPEHTLYHLLDIGIPSFIQEYYTKFPSGTHIEDLPLYNTKEPYLKPNPKPISSYTLAYILYLVFSTNVLGNRLLFAQKGLDLFYINGENFYHLYFYLVYFSRL